MYGDAHKKLTDSGDWRASASTCTTTAYMLEDTVLGLAFLVLGGALCRRRCAGGARPAGAGGAILWA